MPPDDSQLLSGSVHLPATGWSETASRNVDAPPSTSVGFVPSLPPPAPLKSAADPLLLIPGQQIDDFQVIAVLGRGAFGVVYLAWQHSLGRQIALKVSPCVGQEGRTLARLDHPHIVRVFSETVRDRLRFLCMQYVPSIDLEQLLAKIRSRRAEWTGANLLDVIDESLPIPAGFDPEQLADRQRLSELDHVGAACWIAARLAEAIAHAHRHGVLHRDLKPGNVLMSQYGRPMLVDFNLANMPRDPGTSDSQVFGGTLPYMAPEHLDAFNPEDPTQPEAVTEQSDIYSLGVILYRLLTGELPFETPDGQMSQSERVRRMAAERRLSETVWIRRITEPALKDLLQQVLAPHPADRLRSADDFARSLDGVNELRATLTAVHRSSPWPKWWRNHPFVALLLVGLTPHLLGSLVNIPYNLLRIVGPQRQAVFFWLVNVYNVLVYPVCVGLCIGVVWPVFQDWRRRLRNDVTISRSDTARMRRHVVMFPLWAVGVALLGWLPGAVWFPWGLHQWAGPLEWRDVFHFQVSVALSGLIAITYSALGVLCLTACVFYPNLCTDPSDFRKQVKHEIRPWGKLLWAIPFLAGAIPLAGAALLVGTSHKSFTDSEYRVFQWLTVGLIVWGMIGFQIALMATGFARTAMNAFLGKSTGL